MPPTSCSILVAPTCVTIAHGAEPMLHVMRPGGDWLRATTAPGHHPDDLARATLSAATGVDLDRERVHLVGFHHDQDGVALVFVAGIPWALADAPGPDWSPLAFTLRSTTDRREAREADLDVQFTIRDGWRQLAEETQHALDLLPRRFSIPEVRATYHAIWGGNADRNFHRWVEENAGLVRPSESPDPHTAAPGADADGDAADPSSPSPRATERRARRPSPDADDQAARELAALTGAALHRYLADHSVREYIQGCGRTIPGRRPQMLERGPLRRLSVLYGPRPIYDVPLGEAVITALGGRSNVLDAAMNSTCLAVTLQDTAAVAHGDLASLAIEVDQHGADGLMLFPHHRTRECLAQVERVLRA